MSNDSRTPTMAASEPAGRDDYIYNRLLKERIIWLGSDVRDDNANAICSQLLLLSAEDPEKDIYLYINSPGGSITAGMAIYDTMNFIPNDVVTVATGLAASMGQFLLSSGTPGKRFATPNARILMHQPSGGIGGTASDIKIQAELIMHMKKIMSEADWQNRPVRPSSRSSSTTSVISGSPLKTPWNTASSIRSQPTQVRSPVL